MMARFHGSDCRVYLGYRDASADLVSVDVTATAEPVDVTTFGSNNWRSVDPGLASWEGSFSGFWETNTGASATTIERQIENMLASDTAGRSLMSVYLGDADAVGDTGYLTSEAVLSKWASPIAVADLIKVTGTLKGNGRLGVDAVLLHPTGTDSTSANGSTFDGSALSSNGGRANLHVTAATGTGGIIKVQHSTNGSVWVDLITFTTTSTTTAETKTVTGTVNRYLRYISTINATSSLTFVVGFARY